MSVPSLLGAEYSATFLANNTFTDIPALKSDLSFTQKLAHQRLREMANGLAPFLPFQSVVVHIEVAEHLAFLVESLLANEAEVSFYVLMCFCSVIPDICLSVENFSTFFTLELLSINRMDFDVFLHDMFPYVGDTTLRTLELRKLFLVKEN